MSHLHHGDKTSRYKPCFPVPGFAEPGAWKSPARGFGSAFFFLINIRISFVQFVVLQSSQRRRFNFGHGHGVAVRIGIFSPLAQTSAFSGLVDAAFWPA